MKTTLNLDDELLRSAKRHAAERGTTLTAVLEDALRRLLTATEPPRYTFRFPVERGGRALVDVSSNAALYELLDIAEQP